MKQVFKGWEAVAECLSQSAALQERLATEKGENATRLNFGQRASLRAIAARIPENGVMLADEVGMGKTRIAVELARCVLQCGGRVAILVPPGLGYQWQSELREGGVPDVASILRSLASYLAAWSGDPQPWFARRTVMVSHAFPNWRLSPQAAVWRWALVPEFYARWRKMSDGRLPRGYQNNETLRQGRGCSDVAESVFNDFREEEIHRLLKGFEEVQWPRPLHATEYSKFGALRYWLERCVGIGLGVFDLIVTDEAHKSRGTESGLSRLLENVIVKSGKVRTLALTATPVELDVSQWQSTLGRLDLDKQALDMVEKVTGQYAEALKRLRNAWRSSPEARAEYKIAAARFQKALSPYLLRRDKREDSHVQRFQEYTKLPINAYRKETEISIKPEELSLEWRKGICAAEALSLVTRGADDPVAKRLRLTLGNGHGIAALLDQITDLDDANGRAQFDGANARTGFVGNLEKVSEVKRRERAEWWLNVFGRTFTRDHEEPLFDHPAIAKAVETIESAARSGEKVLVFGRFTRPLRVLVELLNAREMLRRVENEEPWPRSKVHGDRNGSVEDSEWPAVRAAHRQLNCHLRLESLDETLRVRYERESHRRGAFRDHLIAKIEQDLSAHNAGPYVTAIFDELRRTVFARTEDKTPDESPLALVARAMGELLDRPDAEAPEYARTFCQLIEAVCDRDNADSEDEIDIGEVAARWEEMQVHLKEEYARTQGGFARLMYGGTRQESRRMIQLAFNRATSFPKILVAQSLVGREGLNLHKSCRIVVLLHPEWNPGVVEQQIGRVDRVGSRWCNELKAAIDSGIPADQVPRIEFWPIVFRGTYDEHNWKVLRERWDNLRAQLHGDAVLVDFTTLGDEDKALLSEISRAAPHFSPAKPNSFQSNPAETA